MRLYRTVYADPPWNESGGGKIKRGADRHYCLMKTTEIIEYMKQIPIDVNAHLYLWVTNNYVRDGLEVVDALGFRYVTNIVWVKNNYGLGQYFRGQHELCLFCVKGHLPFKKMVSNVRSCCEFSTVIHEKKKDHSEKPKLMYQFIEGTSYEPFVEVFAREHREGWDCLGDECPSTVQKGLDVVFEKEIG